MLRCPLTYRILLIVRAANQDLALVANVSTDSET